MRGITLISGVIFLALTISAAFIIYVSLMPVIKKIQVAAVMQEMRDTLAKMDDIIREVASQGSGSKRILSMKLDLGQMIINGTDNIIYWEYKTDSPVISPRTKQTFGDVVIGANLDTKASEENYTFTSPETEAYLLENEHLKVYIRNIGSPSNHQSYNTSQLLLGVYQKDLDKWLNNTGFLDIYVDDNVASKTGQGYTTLVESGNYLPYATVVAFMNSSYAEYYINFTLESGTDFLEIQGWM